MTEEELTRLFDTFERSVFRLEQLQRYLVPQEAEQLEAFKASRGVTLATAETDPWLARVAADVAAGKTWTRVRIVEHPLTDYTLYELQVYQETAVLGEWIGVADRAAGPALEQLREDFLIFDDRLIVRMRYDQEGRFLGADLAEDHALDTYRRRRDLALTHAVPLADYSAPVSWRGA